MVIQFRVLTWCLPDLTWKQHNKIQSRSEPATPRRRGLKLRLHRLSRSRLIQNIHLFMFCFNAATFRKLSDTWGGKKNESGLNLLPPLESPKTARHLIQQCGHAVSRFLYWYWYCTSCRDYLAPQEQALSILGTMSEDVCFGRDSNKLLRVSRLGRKRNVIAQTICLLFGTAS